MPRMTRARNYPHIQEQASFTFICQLLMFLAIKQERRSKQIILQASYLTITTTDARKHGRACILSTNGLFSIHLDSACYQPLWTFFASFGFQAKNLSSRFPKKKLVLAQLLDSGALALPLDGTFFTFSIIVCPISLRSASMVFMSTGFPEESLT